MLPGRLFTSMAFFNESVYTFHLSEWIESCIMMFHESMDVVDMSSLSVTLDWTGASLQNVFVSGVDDHNQPFDWLSGSWTSTTIAANTTISMVPTPHAGTLYVTLHGSFCIFNGSTYAQSSIVRLLAGEAIDALDDVHITTTKVSAMATENGIVQVYPLEYFAVGLDLPAMWSEVQVYFSAPVASMATNATTSIIHATTYAGQPSWTWTNLPCATRISITPVDPLSVLIIRLVVKTYSSGHVVVTEITTSQPRDCIPLVPLLVAPYPSAIIAASASTCRTQLLLPVFLLDDPTTTSLDVSVKLAPCSNLSLRWRGSTLSQSPNMSCTYNLVTGTNDSFVNDTLTLLVQSTSDMPPMISFTLEAVKQSTGGTSSHVALDWMDMLLPCIADSPSNNAILPSCIANPMHVTLFQADLPGQTPSEFRVSTTNHDWLTTVITFAMVPCIAFDMNVTSSSGAALSFEYNPTSCDGNIGIAPDIEFMRLMVTPSHAYVGSVDVAFTRTQTMSHTEWLASTCRSATSARVTWYIPMDTQPAVLSRATLLSLPFTSSHNVAIDFMYRIDSVVGVVIAVPPHSSNTSIVLLTWSSDQTVELGKWQPKHLDLFANESAGLYDAFQLVFTADSYFDDDVSLQNMSIFQSKGAEDIHGELVLEAVTGGAMVLYHQYNTGNADNEQVVEYTVYLGQEGQGDESVAYSGQGIVSTGCHISNTLGLEIPATESDQMATPSSCAADCFTADTQGRLTGLSVLRSLTVFDLPDWTLGVSIWINHTTPLAKSNASADVSGVDSSGHGNHFLVQNVTAVRSRVSQQFSLSRGVSNVYETTLFNLLSNTTYLLSIVATNALGDGPPSETLVLAMNGTTSAKPSAPTSLAALVTTSGAVQVQVGGISDVGGAPLSSITIEQFHWGKYEVVARGGTLDRATNSFEIWVYHLPSNATIDLRASVTNTLGGYNIVGFYIYLSTWNSTNWTLADKTIHTPDESLTFDLFYTNPSQTMPILPQTSYNIQVVAVTDDMVCQSWQDLIGFGRVTSVTTLAAALPQSPPSIHMLNATASTSYIRCAQPHDMNGATLVGYVVYMNNVSVQAISRDVFMASNLTANTNYDAQCAMVVTAGSDFVVLALQPPLESGGYMAYQYGVDVMSIDACYNAELSATGNECSMCDIPSISLLTLNATSFVLQVSPSCQMSSTSSSSSMFECQILDQSTAMSTAFSCSPSTLSSVGSLQPGRVYIVRARTVNSSLWTSAQFATLPGIPDPPRVEAQSVTEYSINLCLFAPTQTYGSEVLAYQLDVLSPTSGNRVVASTTYTGVGLGYPSTACAPLSMAKLNASTSYVIHVASLGVGGIGPATTFNVTTSGALARTFKWKSHTVVGSFGSTVDLTIVRQNGIQYDETVAIALSSDQEFTCDSVSRVCAPKRRSYLFMDVDVVGSDRLQTSQFSADACAAECVSLDWCQSFTWVPSSACYLKDAVPDATIESGRVTGLITTKCYARLAGVNFAGNDISHTTESNELDCLANCVANSLCVGLYYSSFTNLCYIKYALTTPNLGWWIAALVPNRNCATPQLISFNAGDTEATISVVVPTSTTAYTISISLTSVPSGATVANNPTMYLNIDDYSAVHGTFNWVPPSSLNVTKGAVVNTTITRDFGLAFSESVSVSIGSNRSSSEAYVCDAMTLKCAVPTSLCGWQVAGTEFLGNDISQRIGISQAECCQLCANTSGCGAYSYLSASVTCKLKAYPLNSVASSNVISGVPSPQCTERYDGVDFTDSNLGTASTLSDVDCYALCHRTSTCVGFHFKPSTTTCQLKSKLSSAVSSNMAEYSIVMQPICSNLVTFLPGERSKVVQIRLPVDDGGYILPYSMNASLVRGFGASVLGTSVSYTITVADPNPPNAMTWSAASVVASEGGSAILVLQRYGVYSNSVQTVSIALTNFYTCDTVTLICTPCLVSPCVATNSTLTFQAGQREKILRVLLPSIADYTPAYNITGDILPSPTFTLQTSRVVIHVNDNLDSSVVTFTLLDVTVFENCSSVSVGVHRDLSSTVVAVTVTSSSASYHLPGGMFQANATFAVGEHVKYIPVPITVSQGFNLPDTITLELGSSSPSSKVRSAPRMQIHVWDSTVGTPDTPANMQSTALSGDSILLSWGPPKYTGGVSVWDVMYNVSIYPPSYHFTTTNTSYLVRGLQADTVYSAQASAINVNGSSIWTLPLIVQTLPATSPAPPTSATVVGTYATWVTLQWSMDSLGDGGVGLRSCRVWNYNLDSNLTTLVLQASVPFQFPYTIPNLTPQTIYTMAITCTNAAQLESTSFQFNFTTAAVDVPYAPTHVDTFRITGGSLGIAIPAPFYDGGAAIENFTVMYRSTICGNATFKLVLSWSPPVDSGGVPIVGYGIKQWNPDGTFVLAVDNPADPSTSVIVPNLAQNTRYRFAVVPYNTLSFCSSDEGLSNQLVVLTMNATVPDAPLPPILVNNTGGSVTLQWFPPAQTGGFSIKSYWVYGVLNNDDNWAVLYSGNATSFVQYGLQASTNYPIQVAAVSIVGSSANSSVATLIWTAPKDTGGLLPLTYTIYRGSTSILANIDTTYAEDAIKLSANTSYSYSIVAQNGVAQSVASSSFIGRTSAPSLPKPPTLDAVATSGGAMSWSWSLPNDTGGVPLTNTSAIVLDILTNASTVYTNLWNKSSYYVGGLTALRSYKVRTWVTNRIGNSSVVEVIATTTAPTVPVPPVAGLPTALNVSSGWISIAFPKRDTALFDSGGTPLTGGNVYLNNLLVKTVAPGNLTSVVLTGLQARSVYNVTTTFTNAVGESVLSGILSVTTLPMVAPSGVPQPLVLRDRSSWYLNLTWSAPVDSGGSLAVVYDIRYKEASSSPTSPWINQTVADTAIILSDLRALQGYLVAIRSTNEAGSSAWSPSVNFSTTVEAAGFATFSLLLTRVSQSNGSVSIAVTRNASGISGSVMFSTQSGTAVAGTHFVESSGLVYFAPTSTSATIHILFFNDTFGCTPSGRTFGVSIAAAAGSLVRIGPVSNVTVVMEDDNSGGLVGFEATSIDQLQLLPAPFYTPLNVTIVRSGHALTTINASVAVNFTMSTATMTRQIQSIPSFVVLTPNQSIAVATIYLVNDGIYNLPSLFFILNMTLPNSFYSCSMLNTAAAVTKVTISERNVVSPPGPPTHIAVAWLTGGLGRFSWSAPANSGGYNLPVTFYTVKIVATGFELTNRVNETSGIPIAGYAVRQYSSLDIVTNSPSIAYQDETKALTNVTLFNMKPNTTYVFAVVALTSMSHCFNPSYIQESNRIVVKTKLTTAPSTPAAPIVTKATGGMVEITWTPPLDSGGSTSVRYVLYALPKLPLYNGTNVSFANYGFRALSNQSYYVVAFSEGGSSTPSPTTLAATTDVSSPSAPTSIGVTKAMADRLVFVWQSPIDTGGATVSDYEIRRNEVSIGHSNTTSFEDSGLMASTSYTYTIMARNSRYPSAFSDPVTFRTANATAPSAPLNVRTVVTGGTVAASWDPPYSNGGLASLGTHCLLTRTGALVQDKWIPTTSSTCVFTGLTQNTTYQVTLFARNDVSNGTAAVVNATTSKATPPTSPSIPVVRSQVGAFVVVEMTLPLDAGGLSVSKLTLYRNSTIIGVVPVTSSNVSSYNISTGGLLARTRYVFQASAFNGYEGPLSDGLVFTTAAPSTPSMVDSVRLVEATATSVAINWTLPVNDGGSPDTLAFDIRIQSSQSNTTASIVKNTSMVVLGLAPNTLYNISVRCRNVAGASTWSNVQQMQTLSLAKGTCGWGVSTVQTKIDAGSVSVPLVRRGGTSGAVRYTIRSTSTGNVVFTCPSSITLQDLQTQASVVVAITASTAYNPNASISLELIADTSTNAVVTSLFANVTIFVDEEDNAGVFDFSMSTITVREDAGLVSIPIRRLRGAMSTVVWTPSDATASRNGTARSGTEYQLLPNQRISFATNVTQASLIVSIINNQRPQFPLLFFCLTLVKVSGGGYLNRAGNDVLCATIYNDWTPAIPSRVPNQLNVVKSTGGLLQLAWLPPPYTGGSGVFITQYSVHVFSNGSLVKAVTTLTNATAASIGGLMASTTYTLSICAVNRIGTSSGMNFTARTTSLPSLPGTVTSVQLSQVTGGFMQLVISPPDDTGGVVDVNYTVVVYSRERSQFEVKCCEVEF
ncbi:hypothetical protein DYB34_001661 [Aphanomyces astaci]|uniref:Uncharacterized protein n=2 Tax=Aphanomyces astaci TaxID=112090 RepID=A0A418BVT6_APHAT|nr:hypothetical protein DYB34_001661 [Aphanomyces astaci]